MAPPAASFRRVRQATLHRSRRVSQGHRLAVVLLVALGLATGALADTFYVAPPPAGGDGNPGSAGAPWATLQHAADSIGPGDTVIVRAGQYAAFEVEIEATEAQPVIFRAAPGELVELVTDLPGRQVGVNVENSSWITIEGFRADNRGIAGFRAALSEHVTFRGNVAQNNGVWGIFTGCCDDVVIEGNLTSGSCEEHGIYVSNSGDRPVIRGNVIFDNNANGIHMNGDLSSDCEEDTDNDGLIEQALVEGNLIFDNGHGECTSPGGGSGVNGDGLQDSVIRNNVIWDAHHSGISLYQIDGGAPAHGNRVLGNTIHTASDGRWAINIMNGSQGTVIRDNILYSDHSFRGAISACATCLTGLSSDLNATEDRFSVDGGGTGISLTEWRTATSQDASSFVASTGVARRLRRHRQLPAPRRQRRSQRRCRARRAARTTTRARRGRRARRTTSALSKALVASSATASRAARWCAGPPPSPPGPGERSQAREVERSVGGAGSPSRPAPRRAAGPVTGSGPCGPVAPERRAVRERRAPSAG